MIIRPTRRATVGLLLGGAAALGSGVRGLAATLGAGPGTFGDEMMTIEIDSDLRTRLLRRGTPITSGQSADAIDLDDGSIVDRFPISSHTHDRVAGPHGPGRRLQLRGIAGGPAIEKQVSMTLFDRYPGLVLLEIAYRNVGTRPLGIAGWRAAAYTLASHPEGAWSYSGASYSDRRDWVQPVTLGFGQANFLGMNATDYGGGTPVSVVWRRDVGLAVGHVDTVPRRVSIPVAGQPDGSRIAVASAEPALLSPGATLSLPPLMVVVHEGDHFSPLDAYRRMMGERGISAPAIPDPSYGPVWCAWGYGRDFTTAQVETALGKASDIGLSVAGLDDGWQTNIGDWDVNRAKFPRGALDLAAFARRVHDKNMRARLWLAPLAAHPSSNLLRDNPDMLLLDRNGAAQNISFWDSFTLCPAYPPVVDYFRGVVRRVIGEWGFDGLKLDGQHLNGVAPCHNPAHRHARPDASVEQLPAFHRAIYQAAIETRPDAVVEICPCGDAFAFHNVAGMNHTPASDPVSSWVVRLKGKTLKALIGPSAPFAGDHVELSDNHNDFASTYGIGGIISTKFTWPDDPPHPTDPLPPGGIALTPEKEALWRKWIALYHRNMLPKGEYLGGLYDIGFDKPEGHAVRVGDRLHYAFYAERHSGALVLRGLDARRYALSDGLSRRPLGQVSGPVAAVPFVFERFALVEAVPV